MPLPIAAIASSRTPKWKLRPSGVAACWSGTSLIQVLFDGARSADPPINVGRCGASALMALPEADRVAKAPSSGLNTGKSASHPLGSRRLQAVSHSAARAASAACHTAKRSLHALWAAAPRWPASS